MQHNNPSISEEFQRKFNFKGQSQSNDVIDVITPTIELTNNINIIRTRTSDGAVLTTATDKLTYLTHLSMMYDKNVTDTGSSFTVSCYINGVSQILLSLPCITLTAEKDNITECYLPNAIKIDKGTNISMNLTGTFSVAKVCLKGYTQEIYV